MTLATVHGDSLRSVQLEWDAVIQTQAPIHFADMTARPSSTWTRRFEKDDRLEATPARDFLQVVRALRKEQPGLLRAVVDYLTDARNTTTSLDVTSRINGAIQAYAAAIDEAASLITAGPLSAQQVSRLRRQHALSIHAMNKLINSAEAQLAKQGVR